MDESVSTISGMAVIDREEPGGRRQFFCLEEILSFIQCDCVLMMLTDGYVKIFEYISRGQNLFLMFSLARHLPVVIFLLLLLLPCYIRRNAVLSFMALMLVLYVPLLLADYEVLKVDQKMANPPPCLYPQFSNIVVLQSQVGRKLQLLFSPVTLLLN